MFNFDRVENNTDMADKGWRATAAVAEELGTVAVFCDEYYMVHYAGESYRFDLPK